MRVVAESISARNRREINDRDCGIRHVYFGRRVVGVCRAPFSYVGCKSVIGLFRVKFTNKAGDALAFCIEKK